MFVEGINELVKSVSLTNDTIVKFEDYFRAIAGSRLSSCKDFNGVLSSYGVIVNGDNEQLSREIYLNCLILLSFDKGDEISLSEDRAIILAKKEGKTPCKNSSEVVLGWFLSSVGLNSEIEESSINLDKNEENTEVSFTDNSNENSIESPEKTSFEESKNNIKEYYYQFYKGVVNELAKRYTSLFESGYEVVTPAGILGKDGMIGLSGNKLVVKKHNISVMNMYKLLNEKLDFIEVSSRSNIKIADTIYEAYTNNEKRLLYFPNKLLEYAYGRKAPSGDNQDSINTYENHANSSNWSAYCKSEVMKSLMSVVGSSVVKFIYLSAEDEDYYNEELAARLQDYLVYLQRCLSLCLLMVEYKCQKRGIDEDIYAFKLRVCDPSNMLGNRDLTEEIINRAFMGSTGDVPFSYKPRFEEETFIKEYAHEFNHNSSQASPLFAYKAYLALQSQGVEPNWGNMILGMFEDGTILKNGKNGVSLGSRLTHHIVAGSRAGKGVMTMNILASGIYSNKAIFYLDRKPDMASLFKSISPSMFAINGGGYGEQYDTYGQFNNVDSLVNWNNVPDYICKLLDIPKNWDCFGDIFYMRALKLVMAIIVARGDGQLNNPNLGGESGILLVADEFKNFQESYSGLIERILSKLPPSSYMLDVGKLQNDKLKDYEKEKLLRDFELSYNNSSMYAVTYLNSLVSDLEYLSTKRDAGFNQKEIELSDVFVIGQHLGYGALDFRLFRSLIEDSSASGRYKSVGKTGVSSNASAMLSKLNIQSASFPFSLVGFKTCDAFFGRNVEEGRDVYLAQTNNSSKAYGRLDDKASNFAYLGSFTEDTRKKIVGGNPQINVDIASKCTYFKPFLVLNDAKPGDLYTEGMFARCAGTEPGKEWVSREEIIAENPNDDGSFVHEAVGFEGYLRLMGISDYSNRLAKSGDIANYVVKSLGYNGSWFDFITDLRPEWCFTVKDIVDALKGIKPALADITSNPVVSEFVRFNPSVFGLDGDNSSEDFSSDEMSVSNFMDDTGYVEDGEDIYNSDNSSFNEIFAEDGDLNISDDEEIDLFDDFYTPVKDTSEEDVLRSAGSNEAEIQELLKRLSELGVSINTNMTGAESDYANSVEYGGRKYINVNDGYVDFNSSDETVFNDRIEFDGSIESYEDLVNLITNDVINKFGGLDKIVSFKVMGGSIVVNGYYYRCKAGNLFARNIPYDVRRELNAGNIGRLFNYSLFHKMTRLRDLEFDSTTLVYDYVSYGMGYGSQISVDCFFRDLKALQCLCIGKKLFRRESYMEQIKNDDVFYHPKTATKFANYSEEILGRASKGSWEFTKNTMKSSQYGLVMKTLGVTGGLLATGASAGGRVAVKGSRKLFSGLRNLGKSVKDIIEESKKY